MPNTVRHTIVRISILLDSTLGTAGLKTVELPMNSSERRRVRRLVVTPDGVNLALELPTGTTLQAGQVLHRTDTCIYVVQAATEDVLVMEPRNLSEAAHIGYVIGNLHRDIVIEEETVLTLWDTPLEQRLAKEAIPARREHRAFTGNAPGEHSH
jgi:urease accessory protein